MKSIITLLLVLFTSIVSHAQTKEACTVNAAVTNVTNNNGKVVFVLHTKDTFMKSKGLQTVSSTIENGIAKASFTNVKPGTYAILVLHDENENNQMDYASNGMPIESYGITNNPMSFGPPNFEEAKFEVTGTANEMSFEIRF